MFVVFVVPGEGYVIVWNNNHLKNRKCYFIFLQKIVIFVGAKSILYYTKENRDEKSLCIDNKRIFKCIWLKSGIQNKFKLAKLHIHLHCTTISQLWFMTLIAWYAMETYNTTYEWRKDRLEHDLFRNSLHLIE